MDPETGFTFTQYFGKYSTSSSGGRGITFRVAVPSGVPANTDYDVVLQVVAPVDVGWAGLAWGGQMTHNPLTAVWAGGRAPGVVVSSRYATGHTLPSTYAGAWYGVFRTGTHPSNGTHWQVTAKCTGCTSWARPASSGGGTARLNARGGNRLAFAYGASPPSNPSSNLSSFGEHDVIGFWNHDFAAAANAAFSSLVAKNMR